MHPNMPILALRHISFRSALTLTTTDPRSSEALSSDAARGKPAHATLRIENKTSLAVRAAPRQDRYSRLRVGDILSHRRVRGWIFNHCPYATIRLPKSRFNRFSLHCFNGRLSVTGDGLVIMGPKRPMKELSGTHVPGK